MSEAKYLSFMEANLAAATLPNPFNRGEKVLDLVLADVAQHSPLERQIAKDLEERAEHGLWKYGQYLRTQDGRPPLWDAYQEALDLLMYVKKDRANGLVEEYLVQEVWAIVNELRRVLNRREEDRHVS